MTFLGAVVHAVLQETGFRKWCSAAQKVKNVQYCKSEIKEIL